MFVPDFVTTLTMPPDARPYWAEKLEVMTENSCTESIGMFWPIAAVNSSLLADPSNRMLVLADRRPLIAKPVPRFAVLLSRTTLPAIPTKSYGFRVRVGRSRICSSRIVTDSSPFVRLMRGSIRRDRDRFGRAGQDQLDVDRDARADADDHVDGLVLESAELRRHGIGAGQDVGERVPPDRVRDRRPARARRGGREFHRDARHDRAGLIGNDAVDSAGFGLSPACGCAPEQHSRDECQCALPGSQRITCILTSPHEVR